MKKRIVAFAVVIGAVLLMAAQCPFIDPDPDPTPTPDPDPTPGVVLFFDDFNGGVSPGFGLSSGTWEEIDGEIHPRTKEASAHVIGGENWTDYEVSVDFRFDDLEDLNHRADRGVAVRVEGQRKVLFWGSGTYDSMEFTEYHPEYAPYGKKMGNRITQPMPLVCNVRVRVIGNLFQAYVNDVLMIEVEDVNERYPNGTTGIEVDGSALSDAENSFFDNFRVTAVD